MFLSKLEKLTRDRTAPEEWLYVPYDQLTDQLGPLSRDMNGTIGLVLIESHSFFSCRPYHKQKLALLASNMRHFALEQARNGRKVEYIVTDGSISQALDQFSSKNGPLKMMEPAEYEQRQELKGKVDFLSNESWLTTIQDLKSSQKSNSFFRMDQFYRKVRQRTGILMEDGKPVGGKYSFDSDNRKAWRGEPAPPEFPGFEVDEIKQEVVELIENKFSDHPGLLNIEYLPATKIDSEFLWNFVKENCLEHFGTYEDAMTSKSTGLFHTRVSHLLNILRLVPENVIQDVLSLDIPLNSKEGFVRQVLGWREFVRLVHVVTEGFRVINGAKSEICQQPGDGGYSNWSGKKWQNKRLSGGNNFIDGGVNISTFDSSNKLPASYWGKESGLNCLDTVVGDVWSEAYSHHITRLMILSNIALLLDTSPRELTDWFWIAYSDAYDWVVEPNVIGMGTHATGELMTTKPYISGANYINKMSDYCSGCKFDPKKNCPVTNLYWAFLERHKSKLQGNIRLSMPLNSLKKRSDKNKCLDRKIYDWVSNTLAAAEKLLPENLPS